MRDWADRDSFRDDSLPDFRTWISRGCGILCLIAGAAAGVALWREPSVAGIPILGMCVVVGALLVALPDYFRYVAALRESPPLPDRVGEAFEKTYADLETLRRHVEEMGESLADMRSSEGGSDQAWMDQVEIALAELRLDCDGIGDQVRPLLPDDGKGAPRPLPEGMLAKALSRAGKGRGIPGNSGKERPE